MTVNERELFLICIKNSCTLKTKAGTLIKAMEYRNANFTPPKVCLLSLYVTNCYNDSKTNKTFNN